MTVIAHWLAHWDDPTGGPAVSPVVVFTEKQAEDCADAGYRVESFVSHDTYQGAVRERDTLREAVRAFLDGAPLDEHGRFKNARLEPLYRASGGQ
jgi:hypothetical protein